MLIFFAVKADPSIVYELRKVQAQFLYIFFELLGKSSEKSVI